MRQQGGCAHRLPRLAHSWARALVSRVKKAGHWALFGEANKSQVNGPNIIENLSKASQLSAYSSSSKDNLGKTRVSRGLGATPSCCDQGHNTPGPPLSATQPDRRVALARRGELGRTRPPQDQIGSCVRHRDGRGK
eukprot:scaffold1815_cov376-Pavlova_lutheri.AAC.1